MELKVWVEGIQRVVCGITEQTTVQEVVIALAQATGRTGRYTLLEKWRDIEKLLPPSEYPVKVLEKWGEYASEVRFLLRRTGASTVNDEENSGMTERNTYRKSLPTIVKKRGKGEILQALKKRDMRRKSPAIQIDHENQDTSNQNSNGNNNKLLHSELTQLKEVKASHNPSSDTSIGTASANLTLNHQSIDDRVDIRSSKPNVSGVQYDTRTKSTSSATEALFPMESKTEVLAKSPVRKRAGNLNDNSLRSQKIPLMPPSYKISHSRASSDEKSLPLPKSSDGIPKSDVSHFRNSLPRAKKLDKATAFKEKKTGNDTSSKMPLMPPTKRMLKHQPDTKGDGKSSSVKNPVKEMVQKNTKQNFKTLVLEQQNHIAEQQGTLTAQDEEIGMLLVKMRYQEQAVNDESAQQKEKHDQNISLNERLDEYNQKMMEIDDEDTGIRKEIQFLQTGIANLNRDIEAYHKRIGQLQKILQEESQRISRQNQIDMRLAVSKSVGDIDALKEHLSTIVREIEEACIQCSQTEKDINRKHAVLDNLNRELRRVNLQQFIRQTGSKITVLPPNKEDTKNQEFPTPSKSYESGVNMQYAESHDVPSTTPLQENSSEGVWV